MYFVAPPAFHVPVDKKPLVFTRHDSVSAILEIRTPSVEDQNRHPSMVIDDYRYDTPNYFTDHRVPNITFEVVAVHNGVSTPIPFRVSSQGGGGELQYLNVDVDFYLGGDPAKIESETKKIYEQMVKKGLTPENGVKAIEKIRKDLGGNQPGTYVVRAFYRPKVDGKAIYDLATEPTTFMVVSAPPGKVPNQ